MSRKEISTACSTPVGEKRELPESKPHQPAPKLNHNVVVREVVIFLGVVTIQVRVQVAVPKSDLLLALMRASGTQQ